MASLDYPFRWDGDSPAKAEGPEAVNAGINHLVSTHKGERYGNPNFGITATDLVFRNVSSLASADIRREYIVAINRFEQRADVLMVPVKVYETEEGIALKPQIVWEYRGKQYQTIRKITPNNV